MRKIFFLLLLIIPLYSYSVSLGAGLSIDYYNNPIADSAASPIQTRPMVFYNLSISLLNIRAGIGVTTATYEINDDGVPDFNDDYIGFYTMEFDLFAYPGILINFTKKFSLGLAGGIGVRLPMVTGIDDKHPYDSSRINKDEADEALKWFYNDFRFIFWGGDLYTYIASPIDDDFRLYLCGSFKSFFTREDQWIIGATAGMLWHIN